MDRLTEGSIPRDQTLQSFINALKAAFGRLRCEPETSAVVAILSQALDAPAPRGELAAQRLPVCAHLPEALATARSGAPPLTRLTDAFAALEPALHWRVRGSSGPHVSESWEAGHANAYIIGPEGLEQRDDVMIGVSLLAPHVRYPDHHHAPEEVYLVMSLGRFRHGASGWFEPGLGGTLHNVPHIVHAMASDDTPLLAIWTLLLTPRHQPDARA